MFMFHYWDKGQNDNVNLANNLFENVMKYKYLAKTVTEIIFTKEFRAYFFRGIFSAI
jgi:hypothetical protein